MTMAGALVHEHGSTPSDLLRRSSCDISAIALRDGPEGRLQSRGQRRIAHRVVLAGELTSPSSCVLPGERVLFVERHVTSTSFAGDTSA